MTARVHELARELGLSSKTLLAQMSELGIFVKSASSTVSAVDVVRIRAAVGEPDRSLLNPTPSTRSASSWRTGAIRRPTQPDVVRHIDQLKRTFPAAIDHEVSLESLGSQFVYSGWSGLRGFEDCQVALVRFSGAIEKAFGITREVCFFYSPYADLQMRTFKAARQALAAHPREVTPDLMFLWSPDLRAREKLDDWASGNFIAVPLALREADNPIEFVSLLRDYIFSRDLFYETTPVQGERFFGRRRLLQSLRDDIRHQRVTGLFGLRKAGKTSVLSELSRSVASPETIVILRDLESLPSPPADPVPELIRDLVDDLLRELRLRNLRTQELANLNASSGTSDFKRAFQSVLKRLERDGIKVVIMFDEIEYLTPAERIDILEGDLTSVSQLLGALRSLVQETQNFTFLLSGLTSAIIENGRLYGRPNPLFSWAKANFLAPLERAEADDLAKSVGQKMGISIEDRALDALFDASGGHAFLYRHLASSVVHRLPVDTFHRRITNIGVISTLSSWRLAVAGNMQEMINHVKRYYPEEALLLEILKDEPDEFLSIADAAPLALGHLIGLGLVQEVEHRYELTPVLNFL